MSERKSSPADNADLVLLMERVFNAPRHLVFAAWTQQQHLDKWSAPEGLTVTFSDGDIRPGGWWKCHMLAPNGELHKGAGVYREIVPDELIVFTHGWEKDDGSIEHETIVRVEFSDTDDGKTRMKFDQRTFSAVQSRDGHRAGWTECFGKLDGLLARNLAGAKS